MDLAGIEPATYGLSIHHSATELQVPDFAEVLNEFGENRTPVHSISNRGYNHYTTNSLFIDYSPNNSKRAIINPNKAIASTKANPDIVYVNNVFNSNGLRDSAIEKDPNTFPIPAPAPISDIVARPAAKILDAFNNIIV